jgi:glycosyltransferase involved in cell wall biosynthesis
MKKNKLVSYCLFTYNQEKYIKDAIEGALAQTYSPLEIIISDDCSSDLTYEIIQETIKDYNGPHKVIVNRNEKNLGIGGHVSKVFYTLINGEYIITCAGDDISKKEHVVKAVNYLEQFPEIKMVDLNAQIIDQNNKVIRNIDLDFKIKKFTIQEYLKLENIYFFAPGRIFSKELIDKFNPISKNCPTEDSVLVFRSLLLGGFYRVNDPLVFYRKHDANFSSSSNLATLNNASIISQYLSDYNQLEFSSRNKSNVIFKRLIIEFKLRELSYNKGKNILIRILNKFTRLYIRNTFLIMNKKHFN